MLKSPPAAAHGEFTIDRRFEAPTARVWAALTDATARAGWFVGPDNWTELERAVDLRVGGTERLRGRFVSGMETTYDARFHVVEQERQLVYVYDMHLGESHHSLSLATLEMRGDRGTTRFRYTEQLVFLDGTDATKGAVSRKHGTSAHFERLAAQLEAAATGS
jgi:uncharacterized protein YndB with AHSA1/START domain